MLISTKSGDILFDSHDHEMPDYWPFHLMCSVFEKNPKSEIYLVTHIAGIFEAIDSLDDPEKKLIIMKFKDKMSIEEIASKMEIDETRAEDIEAKAMRRLRHFSRSQKMIAIGNNEFMKLKSTNAELQAKNSRLISSRNSSISNMSVKDIGLSDRVINCLLRANINTIGDIASKTTNDIFRIRNMGRKGYEELINKLKEFDINID